MIKHRRGNGILKRNKLLAFLKMSKDVPVVFSNILPFFSGYSKEALRVMLVDLQERGYVTKSGLRQHYCYAITEEGLKQLDVDYVFLQNMKTQMDKLVPKKSELETIDSYLLKCGGVD